jgi:putative flippase GtrA
LAVPLTAEVTVLLSFVWHSIWTWRDRPATGIRGHAGRLGRYQLMRALSIGASYVMMLALVSQLRLVPEVGNALSVALIALLNFALADRLIFQPSPEVP